MDLALEAVMVLLGAVAGWWIVGAWRRRRHRQRDAAARSADEIRARELEAIRKLAADDAQRRIHRRRGGP